MYPTVDTRQWSNYNITDGEILRPEGPGCVTGKSTLLTGL